MDPETLGRGHRYVVQLGRQLHPRPGAIALEPETTAHVGGVVGTFHTHRRGADAPATGLVVPTDDLPGQVQVVTHAETGRPIELQLALGLQLQAEAVGIALEAAAQATQARRVADAGKAQRLQFALYPQRATLLAAQLHLCHVQLRLGQVQPMPQARIQSVAERQRAQRGTRLRCCGLHLHLLAHPQL
ncbi:hypothetical protein D3C71_1605140 [compost metagenome]